jgi:hypothetical protein
MALASNPRNYYLASLTLVEMYQACGLVQAVMRLYQGLLTSMTVTQR